MEERELAVKIIKLLNAEAAGIDNKVVCSALSMVLSTIVIESGMEPQKAMYWFKRSLDNAERRLKDLVRNPQ